MLNAGKESVCGEEGDLLGFPTYMEPGMLKMLYIDAIAPEPIVSDMCALQGLRMPVFLFGYWGIACTKSTVLLSVNCFTPPPLAID